MGERGLDDFRVLGPELLEDGVKGAEMGRQWEEQVGRKREGGGTVSHPAEVKEAVG